MALNCCSTKTVSRNFCPTNMFSETPGQKTVPRTSFQKACVRNSYATKQCPETPVQQSLCPETPVQKKQYPETYVQILFNKACAPKLLFKQTVSRNSRSKYPCRNFRKLCPEPPVQKIGVPKLVFKKQCPETAKTRAPEFLVKKKMS